MIELNLPATQAMIDAAQVALDLPFPPTLRCLYARHDGLQHYDPEGEEATMSLNLFACSSASVRTRWLSDKSDAADFARMLDAAALPIVSENEEFRDSLLECLEDLPELAHYLCVATDWEGSVGTFYVLDTRSDGASLLLIPKPRFLSTEAFSAALQAPPRMPFGDFLARIGAPSWLIDLELYDEHTTFMFHSRSQDAAPGQGASEQRLARAQPADDRFAELASFPHWRRALSNFAPSPFHLDGHDWATAEHYFQANKFVELDPAYHRSFTLDSGSALGQGSGADARQAGGKRGRPMSTIERRMWEARKLSSMQRALAAKYEQSPTHQKILLATGSAKLIHKPARARYAQVEYGLMQVRAQLRSP